MTVKKDENNAEMKEKLESILHPSPQAKSFKITLIFGHNTSSDYKKAVELAKKNPTYKEEGSGENICHSATYAPEGVEELHELFTLVHKWEDVDILINHKRIPYGPQLWLPLMWFYTVE
jgi:hypothetical protein